MEEDYPELLKMFQEGIASRNISYDLYSPKIIKSKKPKEEVAYGLVQDEWENIDTPTAVIKENITIDCALKWNRIFISKYNEVFHEKISINENDIRNLITNVESKTDVCNFFMEYMYARYYNDRIGEWQWI